MKYRFLILFLLTLLTPLAAHAAGHVKWSATVMPNTAHPGETITVRVTAIIDDRYHIYSIVPAGGPQETVLTVTAPGLTPTGAVSEDAPKRIQDAGFQKEVGIHEKTAILTQSLTVPKEAKPGSVPLTVSVLFQTCDDKTCLPPKTFTVPAPALTIATGTARPEYIGTAAAPPASGTGASGETASTAGRVADTAATGDLFTFILTAFGAGLLALVTPCVFPMIPVTLAFFTKQATRKHGDNDTVSGDGTAPTTVRGTLVKLAGAYSLGIVIAFTAIGAVGAATVGAAGANRFAANPWVNLAFAGLFLLFALALLEVIELRPPAALQNLTARSGQNAGTLLGVLGMGLTFVIAAFTCTAPFIGTVLVAASQASSGAQWIRPIVGMTAFSTALALPFFLLALFPGLLAKLPRSGAWLATVKGAMGFVELAAALKFLSNADMVWQWKIVTQPVLLALWAMIAVSGSLYLLGLLNVGFGTPDGKPTVARRIWSGIFAAAAVYCLYGLSGRPLNSFVTALLPPAEYGLSGRAAADTLTYLPTLEEGLAEAKRTHKPIFIDFTGYTCTNCRLMENNVFPVPAVHERLSRFVRVRLYTDNKENGDKLQAYQEKTFGTVTLPLYAVLDADGKPVVPAVGSRNPAEFAQFLQSGEEKVAQGAVTRTAAR